MSLAKKHTTIALAYFMLIALLGVFLRMFSVFEISANYKFIVHTHSHIALMGWVYTGLTTLIYQLFLKDNIPLKKYKTLFWFTQSTIIGMLCTFPFIGYKLFSILFSTLFLFASYGFVYCFIKYTTATQKVMQSYLFVRNALLYMVLSSLGPLSLGLIMNTAGKGSDLYRNSIYFYLHFQYNGWFIVALIGAFFYFLEQFKVVMPIATFKNVFYLFNIGVIFTFFHSLLWMNNVPLFVSVFAIGGALIQLIAFLILVQHVITNRKKIALKTTSRVLLKTVAILFVVKLMMQLLGAFPIFSKIATTTIDLVIGYLHWVFLGVVSVGLFFFLHHFKLLKISNKILTAYIVGFLTTELLLFYRGASLFLSLEPLAYFSEYLLIASVFLLLAIAGMFSYQFKKQKTS